MPTASSGILRRQTTNPIAAEGRPDSRRIVVLLLGPNFGGAVLGRESGGGWGSSDASTLHAIAMVATTFTTIENATLKAIPEPNSPDEELCPDCGTKTIVLKGPRMESTVMSLSAYTKSEPLNQPMDRA